MEINMIVYIKFTDGSTSEYDISASCDNEERLTDAIAEGMPLRGFAGNWNSFTKTFTRFQDVGVTIINTRNVSKVTLLDS